MSSEKKSPMEKKTSKKNFHLKKIPKRKKRLYKKLSSEKKIPKGKTNFQKKLSSEKNPQSKVKLS